MKTFRYRLAGLTLVAAILAMVMLVRLASATDAQMAAAMTVSGAVELPLPGGGLPVPDNARVWLLKPDRSVYGWAQVVTNTGAFSFSGVPAGNYIIRAVPPEPSSYTPSFMQPVVVLNSPVNVGTLHLTYPTITGTVFRPDSLTPFPAKVHVYAGPLEVEVRDTLADGTFSVGGLWAGTYSLRAEPYPDVWLWWSQRAVDTIVLSETHNVTLALRSPDLYGSVQDPVGDRVEGATVRVVSLVNGERQSDSTGPLGRFAVDGLPSGNAIVLVEPPFDHAGLLPAIPQSVTLPNAAPITLTLLTSPKVMSGTVRTNVGTPVERALVVAARIGPYGHESVLSDASGNYIMRLAPGLWAMTVKPITTTDPGHWVYPLPPQLIHFDDNALPEVKQLDFKVLTADATVIGLVEMSDHSAPPFTVTVGLRTDEGVGVAHEIDAEGHFTFTVPHHTYQVNVRVASPAYAAPPMRPVTVEPSAVTVIPTITLIARDAAITGSLTSSGSPVEGVPVIAWNPATHAAFRTRSGSDGIYVTMVYSGAWLVQPAPLPDQPYLYTGGPTEITVAANQTSADNDFSLLYADSTLHGVLTGPNGQVALDAHGWAGAVSTTDPTVRNGAPVRNGEFDILLPGSATYTATLRLGDGSRYLYTGGPQTAAVGISETQTLTFSLIVKDAKIIGFLRDLRTDQGVRNLPARVWAWSDDMWLTTDVDTGNGSYSLPVPAGVWGLDYSLPEDSDYVKVAGARTYAVDAIPPATVANLPVLKKDGTLTGTVWLPDGAPAVGAVAVAEGFSPHLRNLTLRAPVSADGSFSMSLPSGWYIVRATRYSDETLINPVARHVLVPRDGAASITLNYRQPDATITGNVTLTGAPPLTGTVALFAWTNDGGYNRTTAELGGAYNMPVISNTLWHIAAVYETRNEYWKARARVPVTTTSATRDLVLDGPFTKPAPVSVLFDPTQDKFIELSDGTRIFIPAGALPATGNVLLHITPLAGAPHHHNGDVLGLTYAFEAFDEDGEPITQSFNQNVVIVFKYNPLALAAMGLDVQHIRPAYFSTTTNSWTAPDSFVVDQSQHEISVQIDHFTSYAVIGYEGPNTVFLPMVMNP